MVGLLFGVVINECIYRNFDRMATFRLQPYYVNSLLLLVYLTMLQYLLLGKSQGMMKSPIFRQCSI